MIETILTNSISPPAVGAGTLAASTAVNSRSRTADSTDSEQDFAGVLKSKEKDQSKTDDATAAAAASQMQAQQKPADNPQSQDSSSKDSSSGQPEYGAKVPAPSAKVPAPSASTVSRGSLEPSVQVQVPTDLAPSAGSPADDATAATPLVATPAGVDQADNAQQAAAAAAAAQPAAAAESASTAGQTQTIALDNKQNFEDALKTATKSPPGADASQAAAGTGQTGSADTGATSQTAVVQPSPVATPAEGAGTSAAQAAAKAAATNALKAAANAHVDDKTQTSSQPAAAAQPVDGAVLSAQNTLHDSAPAAVAIKQPALPMEAQQANVVQQMMSHLDATIQQGRGTIHMQLNPQELGAIDIHMVSNAQGVSVNVYAEQASTGRLLEAQMNQLRQALTDAGVQLSNLNISQHGQSAGTFGQPNQHQDGQPGGTFNRGPHYGQTGGDSGTGQDPRLGQRSRSGSLLSVVDYLA